MGQLYKIEVSIKCFLFIFFLNNAPGIKLCRELERIRTDNLVIDTTTLPTKTSLNVVSKLLKFSNCQCGIRTRHLQIAGRMDYHWPHHKVLLNIVFIFASQSISHFQRLSSFSLFNFEAEKGFKSRK